MTNSMITVAILDLISDYEYLMDYSERTTNNLLNEIKTLINYVE